MATIAVWACVAAIRKGQYQDLESPKWRILFDNTPATKLTEKENRNGNG
jgi:cbb3-type cytochrome oxidase maturation protein